MQVSQMMEDMELLIKVPLTQRHVESVPEGVKQGSPDSK